MNLDELIEHQPDGRVRTALVELKARAEAAERGLDAARIDRIALIAAWQDDIRLLHETARERDAAWAVVEAARKIHDKTTSGFRVSTGIIDALAAYDAIVRQKGAGDAEEHDPD